MSILDFFQKLLLPLRNKSCNDQKYSELFDVYARLDKQIHIFQQKSQLHCLPGCGQCCENPHVEATVFEMMPLAIELWNNGEAEECLQKIDSIDGKGQCVSYLPDPRGGGKGRCSVYSFRPLICRLFGFTADTDKTGKPRLVTCRNIKSDQPKEYERAQRMIDENYPVPVMADYAREISRIDPAEGVKMMPINTALRIALEKVGLRRKMASKEKQN